VPLVQVDGARVTTIEGLVGVIRCSTRLSSTVEPSAGSARPGLIMAAVALGPKPSMKEMQFGLAGNLCRCTGYSAIYRSIQAAGGERASLKAALRLRRVQV